MLRTRIKNTWKILQGEKGLSFLHHAANVSIYESHKLSWNNYMMEKILPYFENKRLAIDVGASYGFVTNELATQFDEVLSSEIIPEVRDCLKENVKHNTNVTIIEAGFSYYKGRHRITFYPQVTGHTGTNKIKNETLAREARICEVTTIDLLMKNRNDVDFIKIDVEGHELKILQGAERTLKTNNPLIMLEIHNHAAASGDLKIIEYLWNRDYRFFARHDDDYIFKKRDIRIRKSQIIEVQGV